MFNSSLGKSRLLSTDVLFAATQGAMCCCSHGLMAWLVASKSLPSGPKNQGDLRKCKLSFKGGGVGGEIM